jgi:serine/threonine protein kinase
MTFPLLPATAVELAAQVADGLAAVHAAGVVHRDLKPENVLVDSDGGQAPRLRLTDFGISRLVDAAQLTQTSVTGTPGYLAPEVAAGGKVTAAADVYALGVILYELCTGRGPFLADNPLVLVLAHTRRDPPRPTGIPDPLWSVLSQLLAKDPAARPTAARLGPWLRRLAPELVGLQPFPVPDDADDAGTADRNAGDAAAPGGPASGGPAGDSGRPRAAHGPVTVLGPIPRGDTDHRDPGSPQQHRPRDRHRQPETLAARLGARLAHRPTLVGALAAGGVLLLLGGFAVVQFLRPTDQVNTRIDSDPSVTQVAPSPSVDNTLPVSVPTRSISRQLQAPTKAAGASTTSVSPSPSAILPAVPTLERVIDPPEAVHSSDGQVVLGIGQVKPNGGALASITVRYGSSSQQVPITRSGPAPASPGPAEPTGYRTTITGLTNGTAYAFTAEVCNTLGKCATSTPLNFTPYGAPQVNPPQGTVTGLTVKITWEPVVRNFNPGTTTCTLSVVGTPADPTAPERAASPNGGSLRFTGKPNTSYVATQACTTAGVPDEPASSSPIVTGAA